MLPCLANTTLAAWWFGVWFLGLWQPEGSLCPFSPGLPVAWQIALYSVSAFLDISSNQGLLVEFLYSQGIPKSVVG